MDRKNVMCGKKVVTRIMLNFTMHSISHSIHLHHSLIFLPEFKKKKRDDDYSTHPPYVSPLIIVTILYTS